MSMLSAWLKEKKEKTSEGRQGVVASKFRISVAGFY